MLILDSEQPASLVSQIVDGIRGLVGSQKLKADTKLPSIRAFAAAHGVSVFTVVEAYDRLVAQGLLVSRSNAGFFVKRRSEGSASSGSTAPKADLRFDARWYLRQIFENSNLPVKAGCGWLPHDWLFEDGMRRSLRALAAGATDIGGYGLPFGHQALRSVIAESLGERQVVVDAGQVLLTQGSSQALDLVARHLLKPGDEVLVDDPGYPNLMFMLRFLGVELIGVPRTPTGYDLPALEALLAVHKPKAFFTQPRLQSPTCSVASLPQLVRLLQLAQAHQFTLVENDIYADLDVSSRPSLASLSQLRHVIHVCSFSKSISPNIRVGYVVAEAQLMEDLAQLKLVSGLTTSDITERLALGAVTDGRWRKHQKALRDRLAQAHAHVARQLESLGFELFHEPAAGLYLWARHPDITDAAEFSRVAATQGIMLGPGQLFLVNPHPTGWLRFNVAFSADERLWRFLAQGIEERKAGATLG